MYEKALKKDFLSCDLKNCSEGRLRVLSDLDVNISNETI